jgi:hypothetical protein
MLTLYNRLVIIAAIFPKRTSDLQLFIKLVLFIKTQLCALQINYKYEISHKTPHSPPRQR